MNNRTKELLNISAALTYKELDEIEADEDVAKVELNICKDYFEINYYIITLSNGQEYEVFVNAM